MRNDDEPNSQATVAETATIVTPTAANAYAAAALMPWSYAKPGVHVKTLFDGGPQHGRTQLARLDAGAYSKPHTHAVLEQIYVIEGEFYDGERLLRAGDMCVRAPGVEHSASSPTGALTLVIYAPAGERPAGRLPGSRPGRRAGRRRGACRRAR